LLQEFGFRIRSPGDLLDLFVTGVNLCRQRLHFFQQRLQHGLHVRRQPFQPLRFQRVRIALRQTLAHSFGQPPRAVDQRRTRFHQRRPHPNHHQMLLGLFTAVLDGL
jgi:hypothetical protein